MLRRRRGRGEVFGTRLDRRRDDRQIAVAIKQVAGAEDRQADDVSGVGLIAEDVSLRSLLALCCLGFANMEVQHVRVGVVIGMVEGDGADLIFTCSMNADPSDGGTR